MQESLLQVRAGLQYYIDAQTFGVTEHVEEKSSSRVVSVGKSKGSWLARAEFEDL